MGGTANAAAWLAEAGVWVGQKVAELVVYLAS
jgi:hypothetical protein